MAKIKKMDRNKFGNVEKLKTSYNVVEHVKYGGYFVKQLEIFQNHSHHYNISQQLHSLVSISENICPLRTLYKKVHSGIIQNYPKVETTPISIN